MKVTVGVTYKNGAPLEGTNPLPRFRDRNHHTPQKKLHPSMTQRHSKLLGYDCGFRVLPYRMQDRYSRNRVPLALKTIRLENQYLRATFLPEYGGRLISLFDKAHNKELLHDNPVIQPGNLAIRNAWLATGIEFNCSQFGHHFLTCDSLFAVRCKEENGEEFLRMYEYERCKGVYYQIDFHLPSGSRLLYMYAKIINPQDIPVSTYWWTNIAVPETQGVRVFCTTDEVIYYMSPDQLAQYPEHANLAVGHVPYLESLPGIDISYPRNYPFATDYFFQIPESEPMPWEAAAYPDGFVMFEASSPVLRYHKMFCWGVSTGGQQWRNFLSDPGKGDYFEIQAGLANTQLHGFIMQPREVIDFVQAFGSLYVTPGSLHEKPWQEAQQQLQAQVQANISAEEIEKRLQQYRRDGQIPSESFLHTGSGYGALELRRRKVRGDGWQPKALTFPESTLGPEQSPWLALVDTGNFPQSSPTQVPAAYLVSKDWMALLENALKQEENRHWSAWLHYGIMQAEQGDFAAARQSFEKSIACRENVWALRNLADTYRQDGDIAKALDCFQRLFALPEAFMDQGFAEEYLALLVQAQAFEKAWEFFCSIPASLQSKDRISLTAGAAAVETGHLDYVQSLFSRSFAVIRECEESTSVLWFKWKTHTLAQQRNIPYSLELLEEVRETCQPPENMDFRMFAAIEKKKTDQYAQQYTHK